MSKGNLNLFKKSILLTRPLQDSIEMSRNISSEFEFFIAPLLEIKKVDYDLGMDFKFQTLDTLINLSPLSQKDNTVESSLFLQDKLHQMLTCSDLLPNILLSQKPKTLSIKSAFQSIQ